MNSRQKISTECNLDERYAVVVRPMNMKDQVVGHLPKETFKNCGLFINTEAPLLVLGDTSNTAVCVGDQGNVGCFLGLPTGSSIIYSGARKLYTQLSRAHECTRAYTCEYLVIAANMSERRNVRTSVVREIVSTWKWLGGETRS